ncbi:MAG: L,D-transpeptidase family protein [Anaerolineales bacterium]
MTSFPPRTPSSEATGALRLAHEALARGDKVEARRQARLAAKLLPNKEEPWLYLAATADTKAGLAYLARALEINPGSRPAKKAIRWMIRRLPSSERKQALRAANLPSIQLLPLEVLSPRRLFSLRIALPGLVLAIAIGAWLGGQPADALEPQSASGPVVKATLTSTPTPTPTSTNTPTPTPTPTQTLIPSPTTPPTRRPNLSWTYSTDPRELANEGRWIDVDLSEQKVTAYEGGTPVRSFVTSTGTADHPTLTGQFRVYVKLAATDMAGPGYYLPDVPWTMYYYRGYALHGTYWHDNFGTPMSRGCVNLTIPDAEWLFGFASVGTLVNVQP